MTEETKQGSKASEKPSAKQNTAGESAVVAHEARHAREVHLQHAQAAYGVSSPMVAAALSIIDAKGDVDPDGYTKSEVEAAVAQAAATEIQEG